MIRILRSVSNIVLDKDGMNGRAHIGEFDQGA